MLSPQEKSNIRVFVQSPSWQIVQRIADDYCKKIKEGSAIRETEWDTVREIVKQEGKVEGVKSFLQEIFNSIE